MEFEAAVPGAANEWVDGKKFYRKMFVNILKPVIFSA